VFAAGAVIGHQKPAFRRPVHQAEQQPFHIQWAGRREQLCFAAGDLNVTAKDGATKDFGGREGGIRSSVTNRGHEAGHWILSSNQQAMMVAS
jgi:hypothetical protein